MKNSGKEWDAAIKSSLKDELKILGYKSRSICFFKREEEYFINITIYPFPKTNSVWFKCEIKPYFADEIFWEVFEMEENKKAPLGLRANGAFTVRALVILDETVKTPSFDKIEETVIPMFRKCDMTAKNVIHELGDDFYKFIEFSKTVEYPEIFNKALFEMLLAIKEDDYDKAKNLATTELLNHRTGNMRNNGKWIYEHVVSYCS